MTFKPCSSGVVRFQVVREHGQVANISSNSPEVNHFLDLIRLKRTRNTWINYAHDLRIFFDIVGKPPEALTRQDLVAFMQQQDQAGRADATVNRRLAAVSSLLCELHLLDPGRFPQNLVHPRRTGSATPDRRLSLYRRQPKRVPDVVPEDTLRAFFAALPTWRDRALVLLMWISCLRVSEAMAVRFQDIECSHRRIDLRPSKGGQPRTVYMERYTFAALNHYLDTERRDLAPDVDEVFVALKGVARGRPLSVNAVQRGIRYYAAKCGAPDLHAHLFRHTGITHLVQQGMAEPALRAFVGHRRPESLLPYLHLADCYVEDEFRRAQGAFEPAWLHELAVPGGAS